MADEFVGFAGLDSDYPDVIARWVSSLRQELGPVLSWWNDLQKRLDTNGAQISRLHWPAGPASHPRMIAIFREHYFLVHWLNIKRSADGSDHAPIEADWGNGDEGGEKSGPIAPKLLLLEMMEDYAPDLWEHFRLFIYTPVGEDQELEIS